MKILYNSQYDRLIINDKWESPINTTCIVRNELNGWRKLHDPSQVVYAITEDGKKYPYMPRTFPLGEWKITSVKPKEEGDKYLFPYFITTTAWQEVPVWKLDKDGGYNNPTDKLVRDLAYGFHFSISNTTLGCVKIMDINDIYKLVHSIQYEFKINQSVTLEAI